MATRPMKEITGLPGLEGNTYTFVQLDDTLSQSGKAADAKKTGDEVSQLKSAIADKVDYVVTSLNKFDADAVTVGYVAYTTGNVVANDEYRTSDYIPVEPGVRYKILNNGNQQVALYDENKTYVTGMATSNEFNNTDVPAKCYYVRFCFATSYLSSARFFVTSAYTDLNVWGDVNSFATERVADVISDERITLTKTATTVPDLCNLINNILDTAHYHYVLQLEEGVYELNASAIATLTNSAYGLMLPDHTDLIGLGKGATLITDLTGASAADQSSKSVLNLKGTNRLENLTVIANNCRYAVHADNSNTIQDNHQIIKNCTFTHQGNSDGGWYYPAAWGEGTSSGSVVKFDNCTFVSPLRAFYLHNNVSFETPSKNVFRNCRFICTDKKMAFTAESMGSGVVDLIEFDGCEFNDLCDARVNSSAGQSVVNNDFAMYGHGNSYIPSNFYFPNATTTERMNIDLSDENITIYNSSGAVIAKDTPICIKNGAYRAMESGDSVDAFVGVAIESIPDAGTGLVKIRGYYNCTSIGSVYAVGQRLGVVDGAITVVSTDDYIARVVYINTSYNRRYALIGK